MNVVLDNIIFSLQKSGGASVVWQQHLQRLLQDPAFACYLIEYDTAEANLFRKQLQIDKEDIEDRSSKFLNLKRYLDVKLNDNEKHIFHSSHYRLNKAKSALNITTVHDFTYEYFVSGIRQKVHTYQKNNSILGAEAIICVSENTKKDLIKFIPQADASKIHVIYNGVDEGFRPVNKNESIEHPFGWREYILYVGDRRTPYKNFGFAVECCAQAGYPLLMIGGGQLTEAEVNLLDSKLGNGNFKALQNVRVEDLNLYYNGAYCLLYLSLYEGFGIPVVEAQKAGCPVITFNSSSLPEVAANKHLMIAKPDAVDVVNLLKELSRNSKFREETIEMGFLKAGQFNWDKTYLQTSELYKNIYNE
ncbi:glycosyltransferase family 4 protein [Flavobacterium suzhouense]|uniref:Glycosyltransferase family 4 protein n=1 Tax=Flavobacterium suzhouense TaxID=1529638 RepID=A0ABW5NT41_9FLAO